MSGALLGECLFIVLVSRIMLMHHVLRTYKVSKDRVESLKYPTVFQINNIMVLKGRKKISNFGHSSKNNNLK